MTFLGGLRERVVTLFLQGLILLWSPRQKGYIPKLSRRCRITGLEGYRMEKVSNYIGKLLILIYSASERNHSYLHNKSSYHLQKLLRTELGALHPLSPLILPTTVQLLLPLHR